MVGVHMEIQFRQGKSSPAGARSMTEITDQEILNFAAAYNARTPVAPQKGTKETGIREDKSVMGEPLKYEMNRRDVTFAGQTPTFALANQLGSNEIVTTIPSAQIQPPVSLPEDSLYRPTNSLEQSHLSSENVSALTTLTTLLYKA